MFKNVAFYASTIGLFFIAVLFVLERGAKLPPGRAEPIQRSSRSAATPARTSSLEGALQEPLCHLRQPLSLLLAQLIVIISTTRIFGWLFRKIGQPSVIGEMVAGICLGPSLLGLVWPASQSLLFPSSSMAALGLFSQVGVILYMFLVGIDLDLGRLWHKAGAAILVSHASIVVPFFLGTALCWFIYPSMAPSNIPFAPFALFIGIAMSITAFPVLARIVEERGLAGSYLGNTAIACAAVDDATAWCLLALVVAIAGASGVANAAWTVGLTVCFIAAMLLVIRPRVNRLLDNDHHHEAGGTGLVAGVLIFAMVSALVTEMIGIHALFGAFLAGAIMPAKVRLRTLLRGRLETMITVLLLPLFFAFTGLRTQIGLLAESESWLMCLLVILVAVAGKLGGSTLAARWAGIGWNDAFAIGVLMNTRGLMELIVLNIGYDLGILSARIFAMMVLMALVTTFMAGPLLALLRIGKRP